MLGFFGIFNRLAQKNELHLVPALDVGMVGQFSGTDDAGHHLQKRKYMRPEPGGIALYTVQVGHSRSGVVGPRTARRCPARAC